MNKSMKGTFIIGLLAIHLLGHAQEIRTMNDSTGRMIYLSDTTGRLIGLYDFPGKIVVADFWITGCTGCVGFYKKVFVPLKQRFENDDRIQFISISADREEAIWKKSINSGLYTDTFTTNLYTGGRRQKHAALTYFGISRVPSLILVMPGADTKIINGSQNHVCCTVDELSEWIMEGLEKIEKAGAQGQ